MKGKAVGRKLGKLTIDSKAHETAENRITRRQCLILCLGRGLLRHFFLLVFYTHIYKVLHTIVRSICFERVEDKIQEQKLELDLLGTLEGI